MQGAGPFAGCPAPGAPSLPAPGPQLPAPSTALSLPARFRQHVPAGRTPTAPELAFLLNSSPPPPRCSCCEREEAAPAELCPPSPALRVPPSPMALGLSPAAEGGPQDLCSAGSAKRPHAARAASAIRHQRMHTRNPGAAAGAARCRGKAWSGAKAQVPGFASRPPGAEGSCCSPRDKGAAGMRLVARKGLNPSRIVPQPAGEHGIHKNPAAPLLVEAETSPKGGGRSSSVPSPP